MKNRKKLYIFFQICDAKKNIYAKPILYAYTDDKNLYNQFKETRNMQLFGEKILDIDDDEYNSFYLKNPEERLLMSSFITKNNDEYFYKKSLSFVVTDIEEMSVYVNQEKIFHILNKHTFNASIFSKKYYKAFDHFCFNDIYLFYRDHQYDFYENFQYEEIGYECDGLISETSSFKDVHVDTFSIFMDFYGYTMNKDVS